MQKTMFFLKNQSESSRDTPYTTIIIRYSPHTPFFQKKNLALSAKIPPKKAYSNKLNKFIGKRKLNACT